MATLASTLVGTFTASMGLYDRVSDKRQQHKQQKRDVKQDSEIKQLKEEFEQSRKAAEERQREIDRLKSGGGGGGDGGGYQNDGGQQMVRRGGDDVGYNLQRDAMMIQRMYDDGYGRYGRRFAQGDGSYHATLLSNIHTDRGTSHRREPTPSPDHLPPTDSHSSPSRRSRQRPPTHTLRPSQAYRSLQCRTRKLARCTRASPTTNGLWQIHPLRIPTTIDRSIETRTIRDHGRTRSAVLPLQPRSTTHAEQTTRCILRTRRLLRMSSLRRTTRHHRR